MKTYQAPWGKSLIVVSTFATLVCVACTVAVARSTNGLLSLAAVLPAAIVVASALFTIRQYVVTDDTLSVRRLFWRTRVPLQGLLSAEFEPDAMRNSIRTFGNGGLFSFTGWYRSKRLGAYRAFVTDLHRTVVLQFADRTVVVSPAAPEEFAREVGSPRIGSTKIAAGSP